MPCLPGRGFWPDGGGRLRLLSRWLTLAAAALVISACESPEPRIKADFLQTVENRPRILVVPPDVRVFELTSIGFRRPHGSWTAAVAANIHRSLRDILSAHGARLVRFRIEDQARGNRRLRQIIKLHRIVGKSILIHEYGSRLHLPSKNRNFDWTLGEGVSVLRAGQRADFALFVHLRDSLSSDAQTPQKVMATRSVSRSGFRTGFASLVDLENGNIVWFNRFHDEAGDLRDFRSAEGASRTLLARLPL